MKLLLLTLLIFVAVHTHAKDGNEKIKWHTLEEAIKLQAETPKKIFIDVYTEWCGYCKKMDKETFSDPVIAKYLNDHFYPVKLNAEQTEPIIFEGKTYINSNPLKRRGSHQFAQALLQGRMSYPSYAILNEKSLMIKVVSGFIPTPDFEPIIHYFGEDAFINVKWEDFLKKFKSELK